MTIALFRSMNKVVILQSFWQKDLAQMIRVKKNLALVLLSSKVTNKHRQLAKRKFPPSLDSKYTYWKMEMDLYFYSTSVEHIASKISRRCCKHHNLLNGYGLWTGRDRLFKFGDVLCWLRIISSSVLFIQIICDHCSA